MASKRKPCRGCGGEKDRGQCTSYCSGCAEERRKPRYESPGPCESCGGPVPLGMKGPRKFCDRPECRSALMAWAVAKSERAIQSRRDRLTGTRTCKECGETHPLDNDHFPQTNETSFRALCRWCWRVQAREAKRKNDAKLTREQIIERAEVARLAYGLRVERRTGKPPAKHSRHAMNAYKPSVGNAVDSAPVEPIAVWVATLIEREVPDRGRGHGDEMSSHDARSKTLEDLAAELGVEDRVLYRLEHRAYRTVTLGLADRMLTRYGKPVVIDGERAAERFAQECRSMPGNGERILRYMDLAERIGHLDGAVVDSIRDLWPELA